MDICVYIYIVMVADKKFSSCECVASRVKHRALTGYLRKNWHRNPNEVRKIFYNCDVSPYLGALPPELRACVPDEQIAQITQSFRENLEDFLMDKAVFLRKMERDCVYDIPEIGALFGTKCKLIARGINVYGVNPWSGLLGFVCKLSFPEINAHYALKLFYDDPRYEWSINHGPWFEVATALATNHAESKDNNPMYMASMIYEKYMLSAWAGDAIDGWPMRENKNKIFKTSSDEDESRNRRQGRRIDWGETYQTKYGALSYSGRKVFRQAMSFDAQAVSGSIMRAKNVLEKHDVNQGLDLVKQIAQYEDNLKQIQFIAALQCQH